MASVVDICNRALVILGEERISTLTDDIPSARMCNTLWAQVRDQILREHPWNCAIKRVGLNQSVDAPVWGYSYKYAVPSDNLRILEVYPDSKYTMEDGYLLSDENSMSIRYVSRLEDAFDYDASLTAAFAYRMAAEMAYAKSASTSLAESLAEKAEIALRRAKTIDSQIGTPRSFDSNWLAARFS
jgi:hypothetical protein